ncbi:Hypothetical protein SRAE_1000310900 [Strongyloides ratti]|uniref:Uncharacterized protein n=1 Tax=Strongyloides ratti TaxID=34506 RepID=A0A090L4Y0_STRRB|nr:Hypothetical protein SRAE_1000310900 [Strongyloides ratti]CEF64856.1 Hypothetical protein SRAE_1000310900 [Strongyloides ratti]
MVFSIKINDSEDGKVCIDGKKANAKVFSDYIKGSLRKEVAPYGYKIIIYHYGNPYTIDGNLLASKSEFVLGLIKLFQSPLQLDFSDCSKNAIERVIHYLKTGDDNFDPLEISSIYDIVVKLDIRPLRMIMKHRIDNAIVGLNVEKQIKRNQQRSRSMVKSNSRSRAVSNSRSKIESRSRSRVGSKSRSKVRTKKRSINDYKKCFDEIFELLKAVDKFNGNIQPVPMDDRPRRGRSAKKSVSKARKIPFSRDTSIRKDKSVDKSIQTFGKSVSRNLNNSTRKSRSISRPNKKNLANDKNVSQENHKQSPKGGKKKNMLRDLSQLSSSGKKNKMKEDSKKRPKSRRRYNGKGKKSEGLMSNAISPYRKDMIDNGVITIAPYFSQNNPYIKNEESIPPSSFTTDYSDDSTALSIRNSNKSNSKNVSHFNSAPKIQLQQVIENAIAENKDYEDKCRRKDGGFNSGKFQY